MTINKKLLLIKAGMYYLDMKNETYEYKSTAVQGEQYEPVANPNLDERRDLIKLFQKLPDSDKIIILSLVKYGNKLKTSQELKMPYSTLWRKIQMIEKKWEEILNQFYFS